MRRIVSITAVCLVSLLAPTAHAIVVDPEGDDSSPGPRTQLPLNVTDERSLIAFARTMPAVQAAIHEFESRGYVAHPEDDRAVAPTPGTEVVCFLAFEKPGYVPPANCAGAPVVMVGTMRRSDGVVITRVSGGFVLLDGTTQTWRVADPETGPLAGTTVQDAPFDVGPDRLLSWDEERQAVLAEYAICAGVGNAFCVVQGIGASLLGGPALGIGVGLICVARQTSGCVSRALARWPW